MFDTQIPIIRKRFEFTKKKPWLVLGFIAIMLAIAAGIVAIF